MGELIDHLTNRIARILNMKAHSTVATITAQSNVLGCENGIPTLEAGDRLTRVEFERRYSAMPELKKAELLEGVVYMPPPVRLRGHGEPHAHFLTWLVLYEAATPHLIVAGNASTRLDLDNELQPDAILLLEPTKGGQARIAPDDFLEGAPEFVGEIASSSVSYDLDVKLRVYRRSNVREYVVWRVLDRLIDWFSLKEGEYVRMSADEDGLYKSEVFPGLWLDAAAIVRDDMPAVIAALNRGLASPDHTKFLEELKSRGGM
jgi:Uma2 family endonuclease